MQSALEPASAQAERILQLFWVMAGGGLLIWLAMIGLTIYAIHANPEHRTQRKDRFMIVGGGVIMPTIILTSLLVYGLAPIPDLLAPAPEGSLQVAVTGEQWWWRVQYLTADGKTVQLANEIRLPVGKPVQFRLDSPDVIHSFWIPALGGKVDMIPGRRTRLALTPTRTGIFRGACAEYCGTSHAFMNFFVVVSEAEEFAAWLSKQSESAETPKDPSSIRGQELFVANGCGACHSIRGSRADGVVGPDLTHVGSRIGLAAGRLPNDAASFDRWINGPDRLKPGALMPPFHMLPAGDVQALASYLKGLQ